MPKQEAELKKLRISHKQRKRTDDKQGRAIADLNAAEHEYKQEQNQQMDFMEAWDNFLAHLKSDLDNLEFESDKLDEYLN